MYHFVENRFRNDGEVLVKEKCRIICREVRKSKANVKIYDYPSAIVGCWRANNGMLCISTSGRKTDYSVAPELESTLSRIGTIGEKINGNYLGFCAEPNAAFNLITKRYCRIDDICFTRAIRPRTLQVIKYCRNCKQTFDQL